MRTPAALARDRQLATDRQRRYHARKLAEVVRIDDLPVTCWCEAEVVHVPRAVVLECRTESCGREGCEEAA